MDIIQRLRNKKHKEGIAISKKAYIHIVTGVCLLLLLIMVPAYAQENEETHVIRIGLPLPLSGTKLSLGDQQHKSYVMALEEINSSGGIRQGRYAGWRVELLFEDTRGLAETGREVVEKLISEENVSIIMGTYSSAVALAVGEICEQNRIPFISSSAAADEITQQDWEYTFRINPPVDDYNSGLEDFVCNINQPKFIAILFENTNFGRSRAQAMKIWCDDNFFEVLAYEAYEPWAGDFEEVVSKISAFDVDIVFVVANLRDSTALINQFSQTGVQGKMFIGSMGTFNTPEFIKEIGPQSENVLASAVWIPHVNHPGVDEFVYNYEVKYGTKPDYHGAQAYAAAHVCRDILERTVSLEAGDLLLALHTTNMMTVLGPVKFNSYKNFTNQNQILTLVIQIQNGDFQTIWPPNSATADCANCLQDGDYTLGILKNHDDHSALQP